MEDINAMMKMSRKLNRRGIRDFHSCSLYFKLRGSGVLRDDDDASLDLVDIIPIPHTRSEREGYLMV